MTENINYSEQLKKLKEKNPVSKELLEEVKKQNKIKTAILNSISHDAKTIPEISKEINVPSEKVLWYLAGFKKYGFIYEEGKKGSYYTYKRRGE
jgi:predicted transcriptional regulator